MAMVESRALPPTPRRCGIALRDDSPCDAPAEAPRRSRRSSIAVLLFGEKPEPPRRIACDADVLRGAELLRPRRRAPADALDELGRVPVSVKAHWMSLSHIDSVHQSFVALVWMQLSWELRDQSPHAVEEARCWKPELTWSNVMDLKSEHRTFRCVASPAGGALCFLTYRVHAVWSMRFNLQEFPLDRQLLFAEAILWGCPLEAVTARDAEGQPTDTSLYEGRIAWSQGRSMIYEEHFIQRDVWSITRDVTVCFGHTDERRRDGDDGQRHHTLAATLELQRKPKFYVWNVILPISMFMATSFASFAVDTGERQRDIGARASVTLTMILSFSAFRIVVAEYVPAVSYLTMLDLYMLLSNLIFLLVVMQNACVVLLPSEATVLGRHVERLPARFNAWSAAAIGSLFVAAHLALLLFFRFFQSVIDSEVASSAHAPPRAELHTWRVSPHSSLAQGYGAGDDAAAARTWKRHYLEAKEEVAVVSATHALPAAGGPWVRWPRSQSL